jgi:O-antigen/teichoic acid export membrane protein
VYATVLMAVDDFRGFFQANVAGHVALCAGVWLLTSRFGLAGVAWSFLLSRVVVFVLIQHLLFDRHSLRMTARNAAVLAYSIAALAGVAMLFGSDHVSGVGAVGARLLTLSVIAAATVGFLTRDERAWVGTALRRVARYR